MRLAALALVVAGVLLVATLILDPEELAAMFGSTVNAVRTALRNAGWNEGVDPDILDAIGKVESQWSLGAVNDTGADAGRGGAYGPTQITEKTARAHGYTGPMADLTTNAAVAALWTAKIMANRPGGAPSTIDDAAAWWNAGRARASDLPAGHVTLTTYIPRARAALTYVQSHLPQEA